MGSAVHQPESLALRNELQATVCDQVVDRGHQFVCRFATACESSCRSKGMGFAGGQMSYLGGGYASAIDHRPFRVLVVSMQVGDDEAPVSLDRRSEQIRVRIPERPGQRNPHMRGTTRALQVLFGLGLDNETLGDGTHVLDAYAMANSVLCSALPTGGASRRGKPTDVMLRNCSSYLGDTIGLLQPTVVHTQGADTRHVLEKLSRTISTHSESVSIAELDGHRFVVCSLSHPAAGPPMSWSSIKPGSYFAETVVPALRLSRALALDLAVE